MSAHRDEHLDLCAAQVLGVLDRAGRAELDAHLAGGCDVCAQELHALAGGVDVLARSVPQYAAPPALRERVLAAVRAEGTSTARVPERGPARIQRLPARAQAAVWAWAAAAVVMAVAGVFAWRQVDTLSSELQQLRAGNRALEQKLEQERSWAALLAAPSTSVVKLSATPDGSPALVAQVTFDPATARAIVVAQQFTAPQGRDFELWAITASGPTSLGVVHADAAGRVLARLEHVGDGEAVAAFAFSLEATGGSPDHHKPSGPVVMLGKLAPKVGEGT